MSAIDILSTGLVYRNPAPHLVSRHAYFGSLAVLSDTEMLAAFDLGSAFEAVDCHPYLARSTDAGVSWSLEQPLWPIDASRRRSATCRISVMPDGELVGIGARFDRSNPNVGLSNPDTGGLVPTELLLTRSTDGGRSWNTPDTVTPPLVGPAFEICATVTELAPDRWVLPTATWLSWNGDAPSGMKSLLLVSPDRGQTWPEFVVLMDRWNERVVHWESKIVALQDGRLLAVAWAHSVATGKDLPNQFALSTDLGRSFSPPRSTRIRGQTCTPFVLPDGRILCIYRRTDLPGLWAQLARLDGDDWVNLDETPLWGEQSPALRNNHAASPLAKTSNLRFGFPCGAVLPNGDAFFVFWCYEDCVSNIRYFRLRVSD